MVDWVPLMVMAVAVLLALWVVTGLGRRQAAERRQAAWQRDRDLRQRGT
jgi:Tfp pilus assembly protein PilX